MSKLPFKTFRTEAAARRYARRVHPRNNIVILYSNKPEKSDEPYYVDYGHLMNALRPDMETLIFKGFGIIA